MLSILIPTYNYNAYPLALELERQLLKSGIDFELLCIDDGSFSHLNVENQKINELTRCQFTEAKQNKGRTASRQHLAELAQYEWVLFLDADVMPKNANYIENYLHLILEDYDAIYGGFVYKEEPPSQDYLLRWTFGKQKEEVDAAVRNEKPYKIVISANFMVKKEVFIALNSKIKGNSYGFDNYFGALLKEHNHKVKHINNEVYHLGLDKNSDYLKKVEQAVEILWELYKNDKIIESDNDLLKAFKTLRSLKLHYLGSFIFKKLQSRLTENLLSTNPSISALQFYKLGYICYKDLH